jgi:hypothetical protein
MCPMGWRLFLFFKYGFFRMKGLKAKLSKKTLPSKNNPPFPYSCIGLSKILIFHHFFYRFIHGNDFVALHHLLLPALLLPATASLLSSNTRINSTRRPTRFRFLLKEKDVDSEVTSGFTQHGRPLTLGRREALTIPTLGSSAHRHPTSSAVGIGFSGLLNKNVFVRGYQNRSQACSSSWQSGRLR